MTGSDIVSFAYILTDTNASTFLNGDSTTVYKALNQKYGERILDILRVRVDKNATMKFCRRDLISVNGLVEGSAGYNGEYTFPTDLLRPVRFEVSYDGVTWKKATVYDNTLNPNSEFNASQLSSDFSESNPSVDFNRNSYKIRPVKTSAGNITNGIYIEYERRQTNFTAESSPSDIEQNLQELLAWDLATLEIIMHPEKHKERLTTFYAEKGKVEQRFLDHYKNNLPVRQKMTFNFNGLPR